MAHGLDANLKYNSTTDFIHLTQVHSGPNVLLVHPSLPFKTLKDLVDYAKANPGKLDYGYTHASSGRMAMELSKQTAGIFLTGIPYRGGGPLMVDANQQWDRSKAMRACRALEPFDLTWIEEPLDAWDVEGHAALALSLDTPIATGEMLTSFAEHAQFIMADSSDFV